MIFDSAQMQALRDRYTGVPDHRVPRVVLLDRRVDLAGERVYLEGIAVSVSESKRRDWVARLLKKEEGQHLGAWFEMMLCGWLREIGETHVEPDVDGTLPDFGVRTGGLRVYIEAHAAPRDQAEIDQDRRVRDIQATLNEIPLAFRVTVYVRSLDQDPDLDRLRECVTRWLMTSPGRRARFRDDHGNRLSLVAHGAPGRPSVDALPVLSGWPSPDAVRPGLREKAAQHKALRSAGESYVIAVLLDSHWLSAGEAAEAWFGSWRVTIDVEMGEVVGEGIDGRGLHFLGAKVRHTTVSGTLAFEKVVDTVLGRHILGAWYIQNPYAKTEIPTDLFPVEGRHVVVERTDSHFAMAWRR